MVLQQEREDYRAGLIAASTYNAISGGRKGGKAFQPWDFFPALKPKPKPMSPEEIERQVLSFVRRGQRK